MQHELKWPHSSCQIPQLWPTSKYSPSQDKTGGGLHTKHNLAFHLPGMERGGRPRPGTGACLTPPKPTLQGARRPRTLLPAPSRAKGHLVPSLVTPQAGGALPYRPRPGLARPAAGGSAADVGVGWPGRPLRQPRQRGRGGGGEGASPPLSLTFQSRENPGRSGSAMAAAAHREPRAAARPPRAAGGAVAWRPDGDVTGGGPNGGGAGRGATVLGLPPRLCRSHPRRGGAGGPDGGRGHPASPGGRRGAAVSFVRSAAAPGCYLLRQDPAGCFSFPDPAYGEFYRTRPGGCGPCVSTRRSADAERAREQPEGDDEPEFRLWPWRELPPPPPPQ